MKNFLQCKLCGRYLKRITNTHLKKEHGLSMEAYLQKFGPIKMVTDEVKESYSRSLREMWKTRGEELREKATKRAKEEQLRHYPSELNEEEKQILYGMLLGDGYIFQGKKHPTSTYFEVWHGVRQLQYLVWVEKKLSRFGAHIKARTAYNSVVQRFTSQLLCRTINHFLFSELGEEFYDMEGKIVPDSVLKELGALGLATWFMDDGNNNNGYISLNVAAFREKDREKLLGILKDRFALPFTLHRDYLGLRKKYAEDFFKVVEPYLLPLFSYKLGKTVPQVSVCKSVEFDSSHWLEDYPGKCNRLHGGRYKLLVEVRGPINPVTGMVMDFTFLKKVLKERVIKLFDHKCINLVAAELRWRSTTEVMLLFLWANLVDFIPGLSKLTLYETPDSFASFECPPLDDVKYGRTHKILGYLDSVSYTGELLFSFLDKIETREVKDEDLY